MEWLETTGKSVEDAKEAALDRLGVDMVDAEFEILEEPQRGLFGRVRGEARVRARVLPTRPREKVERRRRERGKNPKNGASSGSGGSRRGKGSGKSPSTASKKTGQGTGGKAEEKGPVRVNGGDTRAATPKSAAKPKARQAAKPAKQSTNATNEGDEPVSEVGIDEQADLMSDFIEGLLDAFGLDGDVERTEVDDETIELDVAGTDLGLLIGPKGQTLLAVHDLARTAAQRRSDGPLRGRVRLDIGGYRARRREALAKFAHQVGAEVLETGRQKGLEPMGAADRKVVHDTINEIDGIHTISEGDEPRRRVVVLPD